MAPTCKIRCTRSAVAVAVPACPDTPSLLVGWMHPHCDICRKYDKSENFILRGIGGRCEHARAPTAHRSDSKSHVLRPGRV